MAKAIDIEMKALGGGLVSLTNVGGNPVFYFLQKQRRAGLVISIGAGAPLGVAGIRLSEIGEFRAAAEAAGLVADFRRAS